MLLVDTADRQEISTALSWAGIQGFSTNPNLMSIAKQAQALSLQDYIAHARSLCAFARQEDAAKEIMIQGVGNGENILSQAEHYIDDLRGVLNKRLWIKLTPTPENLSLCPRLKQMGCSVLVTAVFTAAQAHIATESGADGIAVYIGRMMRLEEQKWQKHLERISIVMRDAQKLLLLASFRDMETVETALEYSRNLTVPLSILREMFNATHASAAINDFDSKVVIV